MDFNENKASFRSSLLITETGYIRKHEICIFLFVKTNQMTFCSSEYCSLQHNKLSKKHQQIQKHHKEYAANGKTHILELWRRGKGSAI